jgi:hypothetical protein
MFKKFISDLPTQIVSRYETGTTGIFLGPRVTKGGTTRNFLKIQKVPPKHSKRSETITFCVTKLTCKGGGMFLSHFPPSGAFGSEI